MIISSGYNIATPEVEVALYGLPFRFRKAVGITDEERGSLVKAFIVLRDGTEENETMKQTLQDFVKKTVLYKYPRRIEFRKKSLPKTETGKIQRSGLREKG